VSLLIVSSMRAAVERPDIPVGAQVEEMQARRIASIFQSLNLPFSSNTCTRWLLRSLTNTRLLTGSTATPWTLFM
jgi:hypothetical protein